MVMKILCILLFGAMPVLFFQSAALSQQGEVSVESRIDKSEVTVGELVLYEVTVLHLPEIEVTMPPPGINLGGFEIRNYNELDPVKKGSLIERKVKYTIAAYDTGSFVIPPTGVLYMTTDSVQNVLLTDAVSIRVKSILSSDANDILDIKDPLELAQNWNTIILLLSLGVIAVVLGALGYLYYRKKKHGEPFFEWKKEPRLPAHEEAIMALNRLRESSLLAERKVKEYYVQMSEIVRLYLQARYFKPILEMTTTQTKTVLEVENRGSSVLPGIASLLERCDMVKFAKYMPEEDENTDVLQLAYTIINSTKIEAYGGLESEN